MHTPRRSYASRVALREQSSIKMMTALDSGRVGLIKREFEARGGSVDMFEFVRIMEANLPEHLYDDLNSAATGAQSDTELTANLVELFREVDVNGDGYMEWEEFTRFMVEKAALFKQQLALDSIPSYSHNASQETSMGRSGHRHRESIDSLCVIPKYSLFACVEQHSPVVALYDAKNSTLKATMRCNAVPLSLCYVEPLQALIACCSDTTMVRFNVGDCNNKVRYKQAGMWPASHTQMSMCWQSSHRLLYSGSVAGTVHAWDVEKREQRCCLEGHTDIVMQVLGVEYLDNIISGSLDTTINIWDSYTEQQTAKLRGHNKGVNSLTYNSTHRFLISSGFEPDVFVWSPFVSTLLYKLKGHRAALVGCHSVEGTSELLTADTSGLFKLWDLRNFQCIQTFTSEHEPGDLDDLTGTLNCFAHLKLPSNTRSLDYQKEIDDYRIVAASKKLLYFDQERVRQEPVSDDGPIRIACFNAESLTIFTTSERTAKVWDAILGSIKRLFRNVTVSDISAACLDDRKRKFILGEVSGCVTVFNYRNGARMKRFQMQGSAPVVNLVYCASSKSVLAAYTDGIIRVYDENEIEACKVLRTFDEAYKHAGDLYCISYLSTGSIVASGGNDYTDGVRLWDYDTGKCDMVLKTGEYEVVVMKFLDPYPLLVICSSDNKVRFWGVRHSPFKGTCVAEFTNELPDDALISEVLHEAVVPNDDDDDAGSMPADAVELQADRKRRARNSLLYIMKRKLGQAVGEDEEEPEFVQPPKRNASPVCKIEWDAVDECLYTGDEGGHLRKWCVKRVLAKLATGKLACADAGGRRRVSVEGGGNMSVEQVATMCSPAGREATSALIRFKWGVEEAHDGDITVVELTHEPRGILTASTDRCVKLWSLGGECQGLLLQSINRGVQNPRWELKINVAERDRKENSDILSVMETVSTRAKIEEERGIEELTREQNEAIKASSGGRRKKSTKSRTTSSSRRETSGLDLPTGRQQEHDRVLGVLSNVRSMHVHTESDTRDSRSQATGVTDGEKSFGSSILVGDPKLREKNRRLPPYLKFVDPMSHPPIELTGLGNGFEHLDLASGSSSHSSSSRRGPRLPEIRQKRNLAFNMPASVVPPSPGRKASLDDSVKASIERLGAQLDGIEQGQGNNIFSGKRSQESDFVSSSAP